MVQNYVHGNRSMLRYYYLKFTIYKLWRYVQKKSVHPVAEETTAEFQLPFLV